MIAESALAWLVLVVVLSIVALVAWNRHRLMSGYTRPAGDTLRTSVATPGLPEYVEWLKLVETLSKPSVIENQRAFLEAIVESMTAALAKLEERIDQLLWPQGCEPRMAADTIQPEVNRDYDEPLEGLLELREAAEQLLAEVTSELAELEPDAPQND